MYNIPMVVTKDHEGERSYDIYSRLLKDRIIMIDGSIEPKMASVVVAELLYLQSESETEPINIYISSPGGYCSAGQSICSTMKLVKPPVYVTAHGEIASMASVITSCGEKGHRYILPNTRVMLHQASSGTEGNIQDMEISLMETKRVNETLLKMLAENCGKTLEEMREATKRDFWLSDEEAVKFGIVDKILTKE
jgi:ATP-dependent Clp protease protease subunit